MTDLDKMALLPRSGELSHVTCQRCKRAMQPTKGEET